MSVLGTRLGTAIWTAVKAQETYNPPLTGPQDAKGLALWIAIATEITNEFVTNATITPDTFTTPSGPVTGTGKLT